jgi:TonB family protein
MVRIAREGQVLQVELRQSSGHAQIDAAETSAIWRASPLPQPPPEFVGDPVTLIMPINYKAR